MPSDAKEGTTSPAPLKNDRPMPEPSLTAVFEFMARVAQKLPRLEWQSAGIRDAANESSSLSSSSSSSSSTSTLTLYDRVLGGALTFGISVVVLQTVVLFWKQAIRKHKRRQRRRQSNIGSAGRASVTLTSRHSNFSWYARLLPVFLAELLEGNSSSYRGGKQDYDSDDQDSASLSFESANTELEGTAQDGFYESFQQLDETLESGTVVVSFGGTCHCEAVRFKLLRLTATENREGGRRQIVLDAYDEKGKIRYPRVKIGSASMQFELCPSSEAFLKTYHVQRDARDENPAVHAFCSECGVHVLYAPHKGQDIMEINGLCLDLNSSTKLKVSKRESSIPSMGEADASGMRNNKSDSVSTHMTEATTLTLSSGVQDHLNADGGPSGSRARNSRVAQSLSPLANRFSFDGTNAAEESTMTSSFSQLMPATSFGCESQAVSAFTGAEEGSVSSQYSARSMPVLPSSSSWRGAVGGGGSTSGSHRKIGVMDSPSKHNLMHFMRRHQHPLASPKEADEEGS